MRWIDAHFNVVARDDIARYKLVHGAVWLTVEITAEDER